jgi:hypothetical protein
VWWLQPPGPAHRRSGVIGAVLVVALYCVMVGAFTWLS